MTDVKLRKLLLIVAAVFVFTATGTLAQEAPAQTSQELATQRCSLAQNYIKDIQKPRDLRARVDRLQAYRYIYQRLDLFTKRLERNQQPEAENLRASMNSLGKDIEQFKASYERYDAAREELTNIKDCRNNMTLFQSKLEAARSKRQEVSDSIVAVESTISPTVKNQLDVLYEGLLATGKTGELSE